VTRIVGWAIVAVAARLAVSWASADSGVFADMAQYHERAVHLATTGTLYPDALRGPGYPAFLAVVYRLFGVSFWGARVANALVGGALSLVTGWLARRAGGAERAWMASAIVALYPGLVLSSVYLMPEGLYTLVAMLALLLVRHRSLTIGALAGAVAGLAILTRSVGVSLGVVAGVVAAWAVVTGAATPRVALSRVAVFVGACAIVLAPWLTFTTRVTGGPLLDATSGMNVLLGNHPAATGRLDMADDAPLRQRHVVGAANEADANARAMRAGVAWAVAHPDAWLRLAGAKVGYLLGLEGREHAWIYSVGYFGARRPLTVTLWGGLLMLSFPALVVAAALGLVRAGRARQPAGAPAGMPARAVPGVPAGAVPGMPAEVPAGLQGEAAAHRGRLHGVQPVHVALCAFVVATCALHVASFGESRFHLPLVPVLAVAASLGVGPLASAGRGRLVVAAVVVAVLAVVWAGQAPELVDALAALRAPNGWSTPRPY
jgi:4-amino-4-deoxy-L-arabinose transferase-like glycosyltransferase